MALEEAIAPPPAVLDSEPAPAPKPAPALARVEQTRNALLTAPILPTLLKLALPTVTVLVAQTAVNIAEAYYVGFLGTGALAGAALVFPIFMLMTMMSNGGLGSGVASSVARAVGAGRREDADALLFHAIVLAVIFGGTFTLCTVLGGPALYRTLGGRGDALDAAVTYSNYLFAGAIPVWIVNLQAAALRGSGNVRVPALVTLVGAIVTIPISPVLIFGLGPFPRLGIGGAGIAFGLYYTAAMLYLLRYMASGRSGLTFRLVRLRASLFADILRVGIPTAINAMLTNLTVIGARRLRHLLAARLHHDPAAVRHQHGDPDHGRRQCRRGPGRPRAQDRLDQRHRRSHLHQQHRARGRAVSDGVAASLQPRRRCGARGHDLFAHRRARL
jgi:Na+-driven multidrug efflux pump